MPVQLKTRQLRGPQVMALGLEHLGGKARHKVEERGTCDDRSSLSALAHPFY